MDENRATQPGLPFRKMHGLGNDFVVVDARQGASPIDAACARAIGDRHRGVGFDQLAVIHTDAEADAALVFWNADGSTAGACGNATRCVADLLMHEKGVTRLVLKTERGHLACHRGDDGLVTVDMGAPLLDWADVPLARDCDTLHIPLEGDPVACSMGNPHCTFFVDDAAAVTLEEIGPRIETHPLFPERTNVQIVQVIDRHHARVRVWERGVGPTLASGSSSCAVIVNAVRRGLMDANATLTLDGGDIRVDWTSRQGVLMTGPVVDVFEGVLSSSYLGTSQ